MKNHSIKKLVETVLIVICIYCSGYFAALGFAAKIGSADLDRISSYYNGLVKDLEYIIKSKDNQCHKRIEVAYLLGITDSDNKIIL